MSGGLSLQGQGQDRPGEPSARPAGDAHAAQCRSCGVATAYAVNSAAGAGACAPEVQVLDGGFGSAEGWGWPEYQLLFNESFDRGGRFYCHGTDDEADEVCQNAAGERAWKAFAGLRASGLIDWVRGEDGHIVKRPGPSGRAFTVSAPPLACWRANAASASILATTSGTTTISRIRSMWDAENPVPALSRGL